MTSVGTRQILFFTWPIFVMIFSIPILKEKVSKSTVFLFFLAFVGVGLIFSTKTIAFSSTDMWGLVAILSAAIVTGLMTVLIKKEIEGYTNFETIFFQTLVGAVIFSPIFLLSSPIGDPQQITLGITYGIALGIVLWILYFTALRRIKASHFSLLTYWEVPTALFYAFIFLGEKITIANILGAIFIIGSGAWLIYTKNRRQNQKKMVQ